MLIKNIKQLVQTRKSGAVSGKDFQELPCIENAFLLIEGGKIADFGRMEDCPESVASYDAQGGFVFPAWCDSHTHLVFAASREGEFVDRINGLSYQEIAAKGGGILNSARKLAEMSEDELFDQALNRLHKLILKGTGAIEIKSGYGLSYDAEMKILRVIKRLKKQSPIPIKSTFLGAHALPEKFKSRRTDYVQLIEKMISEIAEKKLTDYVDVFCEKGYFSIDETYQICETGLRYGLRPKIHTNQFTSIGGVQKAVELNALSVDHLEEMTDADVECLASNSTIGTLLPSCSFFLGIPYAPARQLIEAGSTLALATDFNPGSSPSGNMNFVISLACVRLKMTPEEAINAATLNGAAAMELEEEVGSIAVGKKANLIVTEPMPSLAYFPYSFASNLIHQMIINGELYH